MPSPTQSFGRYGEQIAKWYLEKKGYEVLAENYAARGGEIDLVVRERETGVYILVEVKTRRNERFGLAEESITRNKIRNIKRAAGRFFFQELRLPEAPLFEIHAITVTEKDGRFRISHFKNVGWEWQ